MFSPTLSRINHAGVLYLLSTPMLALSPVVLYNVPGAMHRSRFRSGKRVHSYSCPVVCFVVPSGPSGNGTFSLGRFGRNAK